MIDAVGDGVTDLAVGDRVWVYLAGHERPTGTAQEYTNLPADRVVRLPEGIGFDVGASLGVPAMTAHRALTVAEDGPRRLQPGALDGKVVLVAGGAGAVGHAAIQLARWAGATVITTISGPAKADLVTAAGAHHVINYRDQDAAAAIAEVAPDGVDLIVEVAIASNARLDVQIAKSRTSVAIYANDGGEEFSLGIRASMVKNIRYQFVLLYTVGEAALAQAVTDVTRALEDNALPVGADVGLPLHRFALADAAWVTTGGDDYDPYGTFPRPSLSRGLGAGRSPCRAEISICFWRTPNRRTSGRMPRRRGRLLDRVKRYTISTMCYTPR